MPIQGFGGAHFDLLNLQNADTGTYFNLTVPSPLNLINRTGTVQPSGDVTDIIAAQYPVLITSNPLLLWTAEWTPANYDPRMVSLKTHQVESPYVLLGWGVPVHQFWTGIDGQNSFQIIPAPGGLALLGAAGFLAARRRRGV